MNISLLTIHRNYDSFELNFRSMVKNCIDQTLEVYENRKFGYFESEKPPVEYEMHMFADIQKSAKWRFVFLL